MDHYFLKPLGDQLRGPDGEQLNLGMLLDMLTGLQEQVDQIPQLIQQARQQVLDQLLGGAGAAFDTFLELQQAFGTDRTAAAALAAKVGALEQLVPTLATGQQLTQGLAQKLNLSGGTMTGPLSVLAPTAAPNPLQMSSLPTSMTVQQALPLLAIGGTFSFPVAVENALVGQVVVLNPSPTLLGSLAFYEATVTAPGTVTVKLKAGLALAAGTQTFYLRVLR